MFFSGELAKFNIQAKYAFRARGARVWKSRLDQNRIIDAVGETLTPKTPLLEQLSGDFSPAAFLSWLPRLGRLQCLELWDGEVLADGRAHAAIYKHCPTFNSLSIYQWGSTQSDYQLAAFLAGLPPQSLKYLQTISRCGVSLETCQALNNHGQSLKYLHLTFTIDAVPALALLKSCTSIESLYLEIQSSWDLTPGHVIKDVVAWLGECKNLHEMSLTDIRAGPDILTPLLLNETIHLRGISINGQQDCLYSMKDNRNFHLALAHQKSLHSLCLRGDSEDVFRDDVDALVDSIIPLRNLRKLELRGVSDHFRDENIIRVLRSLDQLEEVYISGFGISDNILDTVASLRYLQRITFNASSEFTAKGLLNLIAKLGLGNDGFLLSIDMADPKSLLTDEELSLVRGALSNKVKGRLDYIPIRGTFHL